MKHCLIDLRIRSAGLIAAVFSALSIGTLTTHAQSFVHPGGLHTQADFDRMKAKVEAGAQPWKATWDKLIADPHAQLTWNPAYITELRRGGDGGNNYTRGAEDAQAVYDLALRYRVTGDARYADRAIYIMDTWSTNLTAVTGDQHAYLVGGHCGYLFATGAEALSGYSGWSEASRNAFKDMLVTKFYANNHDFLSRFISSGGAGYYRLNWFTAPMASMIAIGVFADRQDIFDEAINYFKSGWGNGNLSRAAWYIHENGLAQAEESGRDVGHDSTGWEHMTVLCEIAWNQGVDLWGYDNNRVLRALEFHAKYNLGQSIPFVPYINVASANETNPYGTRGLGPQSWERAYNHYVNRKGMAAPYVSQAAARLRPDGPPNSHSSHPSRFDWQGLGSLTYSRDPIAAGAPPSGLVAKVGRYRVDLTWWGSAYAKSYNIKRATTAGGPYTTIAVVGSTDTHYIDAGIIPGTTYHYVVSANNPDGEGANSAPVTAKVFPWLWAHLTFDDTTADSTGNGWNGTLNNGPTYVAGKYGNAISLSKASSQHVSLPTGVNGAAINLTDFTISAWVNLSSADAWARLFDFGMTDERYMYLTPRNGSGVVQFGMSMGWTRGEKYLTSPTALGTGWQHIAITVAGANRAGARGLGTATLYVNGVAVATDNTWFHVPSQIGDTTGTTRNWIGRSQFSGDSYLNGSVDDFRFYSGALTADGINAVMNNTTPSLPPAPPASPSAPTDFIATANSGGQVALSWTAPSDAHSYNVKRATSSGGPYTIVDNVQDTSFTDIGLTVSGTYYYVITALNDGGESGSSSVQTVPVTVLSNAAFLATTSAYAGSGGGNEGSDKAVDKNNGSKWFSGVGSSSGWLQVDLGAGNAQTVIRYDITSANDVPGRDPKDWEVLGSNDGTNWTTLDSRTGETFATRFLTQQYTFTNTTAYRYYRLNILSNFSGSTTDGIQLAEWALMTVQNGGASTVTPVEVSWLKLNETTGATTADASGNNKPGTLFNNPARVAGATGNAVALNGTNQYASLPAGVVSNLNDFTVATWVYWNGGGNWQRVFDFGSGGTINMFLTPKNGANGKLRFAITTSGGGGEQRIDGNAVLASGSWHHVAVTLSGSTGRLYVDGQQVGQNTGITLRPTNLGSTTQNWIGRSQYNDPYFNGRVDDFRIYARALDSTAIAALATPIQTTGLALVGGVQQIDASWNATAGASSYTVRRTSTSGGAYTTIASGLTGTSYTDTGLVDGTTYYYVVTPTNNVSGDGANSVEATAITIPAAPEGVTVSSSGGQVSLDWNASTGASGYDVLRATSPGGTYTTVVSGVTGTSYSDTTALPGTTYYYTIAATNGSGASASSTEVNAITSPAAPTGLAAMPDNSQISLLWNVSTGAATYDVFRSTTSGSGYASVASGLTSTNYIDTGLTNGTTYYYVVTATNTGGTSANSTEANATPVALPSPWATSDIGTTGAVGSASRSPSGVFTVTGAGADIWGSNDAFRYVYQIASGDCDITARVVSMQNTHNAAKAGVMIRESLNANSRHAMTNLTAANGLEFLRRTSTGGSTSGAAVSGLSAPYWVRLVRSGDTFTSYRSSDGVNWTSVGSVTISMSSSVQIGLLVCSHVNGTLCTCTFENVTVTP